MEPTITPISDLTPTHDMIPARPLVVYIFPRARPPLTRCSNIAGIGAWPTGSREGICSQRFPCIVMQIGKCVDAPFSFRRVTLFRVVTVVSYNGCLCLPWGYVTTSICRLLSSMRCAQRRTAVSVNRPNLSSVQTPREYIYIYIYIYILVFDRTDGMGQHHPEI